MQYRYGALLPSGCMPTGSHASSPPGSADDSPPTCAVLQSRIKAGTELADSVVVMRVLAIPVVVCLLVSACSGSTTQSTEVSQYSPTSASDAGKSMSQDPTSSPTSVAGASQADEPSVGVGVVEFVEVLDEFLADTTYTDAVIDDPEVFVATGLLLCERLDDGDNPIGLLAEYISTFHDGDPDDAPEELLDLSGWLLGTSVGYLCPQHTALLEEMNR